MTGWTTSSDFPTTEGAIYKTYNGGENDVFILKFNFLKKPKVPRDMQVSTGNHYVNLTWNPPVNEDESSIIGYNIYRGNNITDLDLLAIIDNIYWYNDTLLRNGHTYYYQINAINDDCNGTLSIKIPATPITIPAPPYNFEGKLGNKFVNLFWDKPHDNGGANITKYRIYKGKDTGNITVFKTIDSTEQFFNDTDVIIGILYYYFITAINIRGESVSSNLLELTPIGIPKPPQSTKASPGYGSINLTWKKPTDNGSSEIIKYSIYKSTNSSKETFFKSIDANQLFYLDTSVITGTKYFYYLTSINKAGESESSIEIHSIPKKADSTDPGDQVKPEKNADDTQHETTDNSKLLFGIILFTSSIVVLIAVLFFIIKKRSSEKQSSTLHKQQTSSYQNQLSQHHYYPPQPPILQTNLQQQWQQNSQYKCKFCNTIIQDPDICPYCGWIRKF